jgi:hypothetical protein
MLHCRPVERMWQSAEITSAAQQKGDGENGESINEFGWRSDADLRGGTLCKKQDLTPKVSLYDLTSAPSSGTGKITNDFSCNMQSFRYMKDYKGGFI